MERPGVSCGDEASFAPTRLNSTTHAPKLGARAVPRYAIRELPNRGGWGTIPQFRAPRAPTGDASTCGDWIGQRMKAQWKRMPSDNPSICVRHAHFTAELVSAVRSGLGDHHERARAHLRNALNVRAHTDGSSMFSWYRLVEICEALYRATDDDGYRNLALALSRRHTRIQPMFAWSWAVVARYTSSDAERQRALRAALHLDQRSALLEGVPAHDVATAHRWLERRTPFVVDRSGES